MLFPFPSLSPWFGRILKISDRRKREFLLLFITFCFFCYLPSSPLAAPSGNPTRRFGPEDHVPEKKKISFPQWEPACCLGLSHFGEIMLDREHLSCYLGSTAACGVSPTGRWRAGSSVHIQNGDGGILKQTKGIIDCHHTASLYFFWEVQLGGKPPPFLWS